MSHSRKSETLAYNNPDNQQKGNENFLKVGRNQFGFQNANDQINFKTSDCNKCNDIGNTSKSKPKIHDLFFS